MSGSNINSVFYAETYHPIQAGSIDGTDILPHDNAVYRALLCSSAGLYDPLGDSKVIGDPYCTVFVGHLSHNTTEDTLHKAMSKYGRVKNLRMVRHIVTGASRGYAFVEYETDREMRRAYKDAHHSIIDDCQIIVDYNRQQLMPGWIPRRLGGGLGGKKESGQLRFGGRERPFRAPLRPIPYDDLKRLGISPPREGRYMSRFQVPSPPRRKGSTSNWEEGIHQSSVEREERLRGRSSDERKEHSFHKTSFASTEMYERYRKKGSSDDLEDYSHRRSSGEMEDRSTDRISLERDGHIHKRTTTDKDSHSRKRSSKDSDKRSHKHHRSHRRETSHDPSSDN